MGVLRLLFGLLITILIALLAVLNLDNVPFYWSPFNDFITVPLYSIALASMVVGFIIGGVAVWINTSNVRREKCNQKKRIKVLEKETLSLKENNSKF